MVYAAINLAVLTVLFFIIGMIKPQWPLFFMKEPTRFLILIITTLLVMTTVTLFGEGHRRNTLAEELAKPVSESAAPVPVPVPVPAPEIK